MNKWLLFGVTVGPMFALFLVVWIQWGLEIRRGEKLK